MDWRRSGSRSMSRNGSTHWLPLMLMVMILAATPVAANGLPMGVLGPVGNSAGGILYPADSTVISVIDETLVLDLRHEGAQRIRATYRMRNSGKQAVDVMTAFPVPGIIAEGAVRAWVDGQPLAVSQPKTTVELETSDVAVNRDWLDPFTGTVYSPRYIGGFHEPNTPPVTFTVAFAPEQTRLLEVEYAPRASRDYSRFIAPAWRYDYLLRPARHWASFGTLHIELLAPADRAVAVRPALDQVEPGKYVGDFPGLPTDNLSVFVAPGSGSGVIGSWWWQRSGRAVVLALLLATVTLGAAALRRWVHPLAGGAALMIAWLGFVLNVPAHLFSPDPFGFMKTWFLFIPFSLVVSLLMYRALWPGGSVHRPSA